MTLGILKLSLTLNSSCSVAWWFPDWAFWADWSWRAFSKWVFSFSGHPIIGGVRV